MSELLIQTGHWNSLVAGEVESFLCGVCILMGLTKKREDFVNQVHVDIHGTYNPYKDESYVRSAETCGRLPSNVVLGMIMKHCSSDQKKQLKIWYTQLLAIEPMDEENILVKMMLPELSNTINTF